MLISAGCQISFSCPQPTPMLLLVSPHPSRDGDLVAKHQLEVSPNIRWRNHTDGFGNICTRIDAPSGDLAISTNFVIRDSGLPDPVAPWAQQIPPGNLPDELLVYLLGSRYCDTDRLSEVAWTMFGQTQPGWARVQAICDFVHNHIRFNYEQARSTRTAHDGYMERVGVCRDFAHLAIALCRCMNIPARYCTGFLGDIGVPKMDAPMDFSAWFEVYLSGEWYTFDARHNVPRIGRILVARGRDAMDVAISMILVNAFSLASVSSRTSSWAPAIFRRAFNKGRRRNIAITSRWSPGCRDDSARHRQQRHHLPPRSRRLARSMLAVTPNVGRYHA
jgi:transglutaminase-like putative cysteine protease